MVGSGCTFSTNIYKCDQTLPTEGANRCVRDRSQGLAVWPTLTATGTDVDVRLGFAPLSAVHVKGMTEIMTLPSWESWQTMWAASPWNLDNPDVFSPSGLGHGVPG